MKAVVFHEYGQSDVLAVEEVEKPAAGNREVLVEIHATCINSWDWELIRGVPFLNRLMAGIFRPTKIKIPGCDIAGRVVALGKSVERFQVGDEVFGDLSRSGWGGFAEYVSAPENALSLKPACLTFEQAAAVPQAALLAYQGLQRGEIQAGKRILINGAGGGSGTFAIQMAKNAGAEVTAVDSTEKQATMSALGADHVIDYTKKDYTEGGQQYDLIFDNVANRPLANYKRVLNPDGVFVMVGGESFSILRAMLSSLTGNRKIRLLLHKANKGLEDVKQVLESGKLLPVIDRCYPLDQVPLAMRYFGEGHAKGKIIITIKQ